MTVVIDRIAERYRQWRSTESGKVIYTEFVERSLDVYSIGRRHYGAQCIVESIRFDWTVNVKPDRSGYKISNDFVALLAREVMAEFPKLRGFFQIKPRWSAGEW